MENGKLEIGNSLMGNWKFGIHVMDHVVKIKPGLSRQGCEICDFRFLISDLRFF
jgi:hypothetical protein